MPLGSGAPFDTFAQERRWVAWRYELRGGKLTKVPYAPFGGRAKAGDPSTWGTRVDSCIAEDGTLARWAAKILSVNPTYTERSPSGNGVKLFF
jgi:putative DNA primase/helicase